MVISYTEHTRSRNMEATFRKNHETSGKKGSRARVPIEGQCVLLQNSLRIKLFDFFLNSQNNRMNHIFLDILLNP